MSAHSFEGTADAPTSLLVEAECVLQLVMSHCEDRVEHIGTAVPECIGAAIRLLTMARAGIDRQDQEARP